jgi:CRISPR-associated protein Csx17
MNDIVLTGCQPEPLASYLKALGVLRLVSEQLDATVRGYWAPDGFTLRTVVSAEDLCAYFLEMYSPTPIVSPWNGGSGFHPKDSTDGLDAILASSHPRLGLFQNVINTVKAIGAFNKDDDKADYLLRLRNQLPDEALGWLDAAAILSSKGIRFPILLGTGGNDGRLDFSNNFMQRLGDAIGLAKTKKGTEERPRTWLSESLFGVGDTPLLDAAIGQFDPGGAGGSNSAPQGKGKSLVNPWNFVLMMEGTILFSGAAVRRRGTDSAAIAVPFSFAATSAGFGSASEENGRGEIWAPLWAEPARLGSVETIFAEGRITWNGQDAKSGLDAIRGIATLQHDRRINGFSRYVIAERFGLSNIAVPVGRIRTPSQSEIDVALTGQIDRWMRTFREVKSAAIRSQMRQLESAIFDLANAGTSRNRSELVVEVLSCTASLERAVSRSNSTRENVRPIRGLRASDWEDALQPVLRSSLEARIAWALASGRDGYQSTQAKAAPRSLREMLLPIDGSRWTASAPVDGIETRPLSKVLAAAAERREWQTLTAEKSQEGARKGGRIAHSHGGRIDLSDAIALATANFEESTMTDLLRAFLVLDFETVSGVVVGEKWKTKSCCTVLSAAVLVHCGSREPAIASPGGLPRRLAASSYSAIDLLKRSLNSDGYSLMISDSMRTEDMRWLPACLLLTPNFTDASIGRLKELAGFPSPRVERSSNELSDEFNRHDTDVLSNEQLPTNTSVTAD